MGEVGTYTKIVRVRDQIIFGDGYREELYSQGLRYFNGLRRQEIRKLMEKRIFDTYPWVRYMEYVWFMEEFGDDDQLYLSGFVYGLKRADFPKRQGGICIDGIGRNKKWQERNDKAEEIFEYLFGDADVFGLNPPWAWYD